MRCPDRALGCGGGFGYNGQVLPCILAVDGENVKSFTLKQRAQRTSRKVRAVLIIDIPKMPPRQGCGPKSGIWKKASPFGRLTRSWRTARTSLRGLAMCSIVILQQTTSASYESIYCPKRDPEQHGCPHWTSPRSVDIARVETNPDCRLPYKSARGIPLCHNQSR